MSPWLETIGIVLIALLGVFLGKLFSRPRRAVYWMAGYLLSVSLIFFLLIIRYSNSLAFTQPFVWISAGRVKFVIFSLAVTMGLTAPLSRLPYKFEKAAVCVLMVIIVFWFSVLPFLVPALIQNYLANLTTLLDANGVCFQTTDYTCAPAAAVTALGKLGLTADEGEIAILAHTSPVVGTLPGCLQSALQNRYGSEGLKCQYRRFDSIAQLKDAGLTLAVVKSAFLTDHCVAVLEVGDRMITIADPAGGKMLMSHKQFEEIWRFSGIVLKRDSTQGRVS
ncbi:MAG: cysteine peptidase family C39 domain-containing protein [Phycisphaerae bacterium]|nr:cysteine peptidase family C39 domain-containing protein [Phycisphaerae bacterium]MDD5381980.1 cysteine peptidase family C39 domain-containing protein [Phycisphaerae bacterium]